MAGGKPESEPRMGEGGRSDLTDELLRRGRRLDMHRWSVDATGPDPHRVVMPTAGANGLKAAVLRQEHLVPAAEGVGGRRCGVVRMDHHLGDARLAGPRWRAFRRQTILTGQGGPDTGPVESLATDGVGPHRFFTQQRDAAGGTPLRDLERLQGPDRELSPPE